ncbi:unnamed protein product [Cuscuta epithymum]|uniref:Uncharacterized protein n=1 Tax=Cuscuta epithymum TaxID=186058 RepID=A0AAV0FU90_9ASTE|nr:unnamed protein product [Cuscuta epithymum]
MATRSSEIAPRNCGRRKTKAAANESAAAAARKKKKQPQRGKGVAELERLLRDPTLKKLTPPPSNPTHTIHPLNVTVPPLSSVVFSPSAAVTAAAMSNDGIIRAMPLHFPKLLGPYGCGYNYGEMFPSSYSHHDLYGFRGCSAPNSPNPFNVIGHEKNSKHLSSGPNFTFNRCHLCHQSEVAVERKKKRSSSLSSKGVVEYDFFPEKSRSLYDDDGDDMVMMMSMMSAPTPTTTTTRPSSPDVAAMASTSDGSSSSTTVDLSLRLSY